MADDKIKSLNEKLPLDHEHRTGLLGGAARGFETAFGDVGKWEGFGGLPTQPFESTGMGQEPVLKEDIDLEKPLIIAPPLEDMPIGREFLERAEEEEARTIPERVKGFVTETVPKALTEAFKVEEPLQKLLDDADARNASSLEKARIKKEYFLEKGREHAAVSTRLQLDPILRKAPFKDQPYAQEGRAPLPDEPLYDAFTALVKQREDDKERAKLSKLAKIPHRIELGKTLVAVDRKYNEKDSNKKYDWAYFTRSTEYGVFPYYIQNATWDQAFDRATWMNDYMKHAGPIFYTPAHKELNTKIRRLLDAGGDPYLWQKAVKDFQPVEWEESYQNLKERYGDAKAIGGDGTLRFLATWSTFAKSSTTKGLPNWLYGLGPRAATALDMLFYPLSAIGVTPDNLFLDMFVENANIKQNDEHARFSLGEDLTLFNKNIFYNPTEELWESPEGSPVVNITKEELLFNMDNAESRNVLTGAVRSFSKNFTLILGLTSLQAPFALSYVRGLSVKAAKNIHKRKGYDWTVDKKGRWSQIDKDDVFMEMKILHGQKMMKMRKESSESLGSWIKRQYKGRQFYFGTQMGSWTKDVAFMQFGADTALEFADRYWTSAWRDESVDWWEDIPAAAVEVGSFLVGGYLGVRLRNTPLQWPFRFSRWTAEAAATTGFHGSSIAVPGRLGHILQKEFGAFIEESKLGSLKIAGLNKATLNRLEKFGRQIIKVGETHPAVLEGMRDSWQGMRNLYYEMRVPRDNEYRPLLDQESFFKNQDQIVEYNAAPSAGKLVPTDWQHGEPFFKKEEALFTIGEAYDIKVLQTLEHTLAETAAINAEGMKVDASFNFVKHSMEARKMGEDLQVGIQRNLLKLSLIPAGVRTQEINALENSLKRSLEYLLTEHESWKILIDKAVVLQIGKIIGSSDLSVESSHTLVQILHDYPKLLLKGPEEKLALGVKAKIETAKIASVTALGSVNKFRKRLEGLNNYLPTEYEAYGKTKAAVKIHGGSPAVAIADLSQEVAAVSLGHVDSNLRIVYTGKFDDALESIPDAGGGIDIMDFMKNINILSRDGGPLQQLPYLQSYIAGISSTSLKPQVEYAYKEIAKEQAPNEETGKQPTWQEMRKEILEEVAERRGEAWETIKGGITLLDEIAEIQSVYPDMEFNFLVSYSQVNEIRKTVALADRDLSQGDLNGSKKLKEVRTEADNLMEEFREKLFDLGFTNEVRLLNEAHAEYGPNYRQRLIQSKFFREVVRSEKLTQNIDKSKINKDGKVFLEFTDKRTNLPMPKVWYGGAHPGGRVLDENSNKLFDNWFANSTPKTMWEDIKVIFGEPEQVVIAGRGQTVFQPPKEGDPLWESYKVFNKYLDNYIAARFASQIDSIEARGKTAFADKVHKAKTEDDWDKILNDKRLTEDYFVGEADSPVIKELAEKVRQLNFVSGHTIGNIGKDWHQTMIAWTETDNAARNATNDMLKKQTDWVTDRLSESAAIIKDASHVLNKLQQHTTDWARINNSQSLVERAIETQVVENGKVIVPFIEAARKSFIREGGTNENFNKIIAAHFAYGLKDRNTQLSGKVTWDIPSEYTGEYKPGAGKPPRQYDLGYRSAKEKVSGYGEKIVEKIGQKLRGDDQHPITPEYALDGVNLYEDLVSHYDLFKVYMNKDLKLLQVIAKIATVRQQPMSGEKLRSLTVAILAIT